MICTTKFNVKKFLHDAVFAWCVLYGSQIKTATFALYSITDWFCITEVESIYCAVRTESLYKTNTFLL
jgi:hypothetical protein